MTSRDFFFGVLRFWPLSQWDLCNFFPNLKKKIPISKIKNSGNHLKSSMSRIFADLGHRKLSVKMHIP